MAKRKVAVVREMSIADAVSETFGEFQGLGEEMRSWADAMEEKFSATDKFSRVSEAADTLENINEASVDDSLKDLKVSFTEMSKKRPSRPDRCGHACYILDECIQVLDEIIDDEKADQSLKDDASSLRDDLDNAKSEAECVEFPGMYG
jgi:hypothetical protein